MSNRNLRQEIKRIQPLGPPQPGILGDFSGRVNVANRPNFVYVRTGGSSLTEVFNNSVPSQYNLPVLIGRDSKNNNQLRVLEVRTDSVSLIQQSSSLLASPLHHQNHEWLSTEPGGGSDVVFSQLRQLLPLRPTPMPTGQLIFVNKNISYLGGKWTGVTGTIFDLSPASPVTGSRFILMYEKQDGLIGISSGNIQDVTLLNLIDIPQPLPGTIPIAAVRLYPQQGLIQDSVIMQDIVDLRWNSFDTRLVTGSSGGGGHIIQDEGTSLTQRSKLNFVGSAVTVTDDAGNDASKVTINASGVTGISNSGGFPFWYVEGTITTGSSVDMTFVVGTDSSLTSVITHLKTLGVTGTSIIDLKVNGTTIFSSPPSLAYNAGSNVVTTVPTTASLYSGDVVTLHIVSAARGASGLTVLLNGQAGVPIITLPTPPAALIYMNKNFI